MLELNQIWRLFLASMAALILAACTGNAVLAQSANETQNPAKGPAIEAESPMAPVEIDGNFLFPVSGVAAMPAEQRAAAIVGRIKAVAADPHISITDVRPVEVDSGTAIFAGDQRLMIVIDADIRDSTVPRKTIAEVYVSKVQNAITDYRQARSRQALLRSVAHAVVASLVLVILIALTIWLSRRLQAIFESRYSARIRAVGIQSFKVVRVEQIWGGLRRLITTGKVIAIFLVSFIYLQHVLGLFPWTRGTAHRLRGYALAPLVTMGRGIVAQIPSILFLIVLFLVTRFVLRVINRFFDALKTGEVKLSSFEPEWAESTYKLIWVGIVVLALVVAYPYIPGGNSEAFKGISIFIGLVFSLGSSSAIANLIAGYTMTYRRAFHIGDRVKIGDTMGDVTRLRLQATHLRTVKNEEVIIPNSSILNNEVVNYSSLARERGLILHTTVGIGYETAWRQVEAMLILAAERTPGIMKEPPPFVLQKTLGDFAVTYEINVYCDNPQAMATIYTALHRNVLDLFNEYGVQIMTPAYEGDPESPKLVPKEQWFSAPANGTTAAAVISEGA